MASDINAIVVGETWRAVGMVAKASGSAIEADVSYYLKCLSGAHAGKWWDDANYSTVPWAAGAVANAMTHHDDGNWTIELSASPFEAGIMYLEFSKEDSDLHVAGEGRLLRGVPVNTLADVQHMADSVIGADTFVEGVLGSTQEIADAAAATVAAAHGTGSYLAADAVTGLGTGTTLTSLATAANQTTILARLGAWTGTGVNTILGAFKALLSKVASAPSDIGGTFTPTTDSTEAIQETVAALEAGSGLNAQETRDAMKLAPSTGDPAEGSIDALIADISGDLSGEGAYTGTLTVDDGSGNGLEGAVINARRGGVLKASGTTDADGQITDWVFGEYTYDLAVRLAGYQPETDAIVVSGNAWTKIISMTPLTLPASDVGMVTGYFYCYDNDGEVIEGAIIEIRAKSKSGYGISLRTGIRSEISDVNGLVTLTNLVPGAVYQIRRGDEGDWTDVTVSASATDPHALPNVHGEG
jgi:hypothetical protein